MELKVINTQGSAVGTVTLSDELFARDYNEALVHQVVNAYLANARSSSSSQKTRAEVAKSTKKPFKQKGTGRARAGMASSPLWRGGGRTFPNKPEDNYTQKINRKMYRLAISTIVSKLIRDERLIIADKVEVDSPKTKGFVSVLNNMSLATGTVLLIVDELNDDLFLSARNLHNVLILESHQVDPYSLLRCDKVLFVQKAVEQLQEQLS